MGTAAGDRSWSRRVEERGSRCGLRLIGEWRGAVRSGKRGETSDGGHNTSAVVRRSVMERGDPGGHKDVTFHSRRP